MQSIINKIKFEPLLQFMLVHKSYAHLEEYLYEPINDALMSSSSKIYSQYVENELNRI